MPFVVAHHRLILRIYLGRFVDRVRAEGLDPDDVLSAVFLKLHRANTIGTPFDPSRASPSTYIYRAISSCVSHQVDKRRRRWWEAVGRGSDAALSATAETFAPATELAPPALEPVVDVPSLDGLFASARA